MNPKYQETIPHTHIYIYIYTHDSSAAGPSNSLMEGWPEARFVDTYIRRGLTHSSMILRGLWGCFGAFGRSFLEVRGVLAGKLEARVDV